MRRAALVTLLAFGCATARPPDSAPLPPVDPARVALAEPELELWLEGTHAIDPQESDTALAQSREALSRALAGRGLEASEPDQLLVVRERAVTRTAERRVAQVWTVVGIVFVVVAIIVVTLVATRRPAGPSAPVGGAAGARGVPPPGVRAPAPGFAPRPYHPPPVGIGFGVDVMIPLADPTPPPWLAPTDAWLASRGWFSGDEVELTVELADARTGAVSWHRLVHGGGDPRDGAEVARLVDEALADLPFGAGRP